METLGLGTVVSSDEQAMRLALSAAALGSRGANPLVGAVLTDTSGRVRSVGYHRGAGTPHAEAEALRLARESGTDPAGCTLYVTLEPCNHTGRTGPCSVAVAAAGVARVIYAMPDRQEPAAGGADFLAAHGVDTVSGLLTAEATDLNRRWLRSKAEGRPFVTIKIAQTLDGFTAAKDGTSQWITGPDARQDGHRLRRLADAIVVGTSTAVTDNPRLTARNDDGSLARRQPLRVVVGRRDLRQDLLFANQPGASLVVREHRPRTVLASLAERGVGHVLLEGGATVAGAYLSAGVVDEIFAYVAPTMLGDGASALRGLGAPTLTAAERWSWDTTSGGVATPLGNDIRLHLKPDTEGNN